MFSKVEKRETSKFKAKLLLIDCVRQGHFIIIIRRLLVIMKTGLIWFLLMKKYLATEGWCWYSYRKHETARALEKWKVSPTSLKSFTKLGNKREINPQLPMGSRNYIYISKLNLLVNYMLSHKSAKYFHAEIFIMLTKAVQPQFFNQFSCYPHFTLVRHFLYLVFPHHKTKGEIFSKCLFQNCYSHFQLDHTQGL